MIRLISQVLLPSMLAVALAILGPTTVFAQVFDDKDAGHAGLYRPDTIKDANYLIEQMQKDCGGQTLVIETFLKPTWIDPEWPGKDPKDPNPTRDPVKEWKNMNLRQREKYMKDWAQERARIQKVDGVYVLICKTPKWVEVMVNPESNDKLFPESKRAWLHKAIWRPIVSPRDDDLLNEVIPGVWYTVQDLQRNPDQEGYGWSWMPVLTGIGLLLGSWVGIGLLRGIVGLVRPSQPATPNLAHTQVTGQTTITTPPVPLPNTNGGREDSVDY